MSAILALDATTANCSVSLVFEDGHAITRSEWVPQGHARVILPWVDEVLQQAQLDPQRLRALAWVQGPGAFTGLRIAAGVVQGLAMGWQKPVISLPSLSVLVNQIPAGQRELGGRYWALLDARMNEVYAQSFQYTADGFVAENDAHLWPIANLTMALAEPHQGSIGDLMNLKQGWDVIKPLLHDWRAACPEAEAAGRLAWSQLDQARSLDQQLPEPIYLRPSVVK
ncbi:tRNA (adenosine(37)-N6)-threonylcarbamoyltransferase complex dimerization subunit type 1 TsaB [Thiomicrospira sp. ALE5]|uniref:tRNA (adenosine(37)-N6)-threonylcarbamoyltransferase complex dimerization subunit type 1 TsaB n=1 Tax=Thiomicrospira sp. ALE5 TaxID=748650 RepID=UPI0008ECB77D|nr:tRNA (adenosine(37)-N6)-threonylcarbamoyltransferase complex dimerization subunit type 1 TsaB [Thiomicrospira sp. ALE5]SFR49018.1 tRNA threonylcarbamoyladenosine biosynthesis protein TsaB [Thiomicrospira sp. ALE5]